MDHTNQLEVDMADYTDLTAMARQADGSLGRGKADSVELPQTASIETYDIRSDTRTGESYLIEHSGVVRDTPKAICLLVIDIETGLPMDEWFPKKVCSNYTAATIHVWNKFIDDAKPYLKPDTDTDTDTDTSTS